MIRLQASDASNPIEQLTQLVHRERAALLAVATREGLSAEEALESVQDALCTWLAASATAKQAGPTEADRVADPRHGHDPRAYPALLATLKHMVKNAARNGRRRHHRLKPHRPIDEDSPLTADDRNAEMLLDAAESSLRLQICVAELREVERAVVTLRLLEERSGEDVAHALGLSRAHVDVLVHRAKATLRVCMRAPNCAQG